MNIKRIRQAKARALCVLLTLSITCKLICIYAWDAWKSFRNMKKNQGKSHGTRRKA